MINYQEIYKALVAKFELLEDEVIGHPGSEFVYDQILELREEFKPLYAYLVNLSEFVSTIREETRFISNSTKNASASPSVAKPRRCWPVTSIPRLDRRID